ncbi:MAG: hypothetical protein IT193_08670 [Propionibacteriaceae bacterium]|nr:hypothetical protein [Propionibacteriaceae bacterium]
MNDEDRLLPAPLNAVGPPPGKDRKFGRAGAGRLVLVHLVWPGRSSIVPAVVVWFSDDRTCVEWRPHHGGPPRQTWLPRSDVRPRLDYPNR